MKLPASDIVVVHRSDGSGTTYVWTDYLSKISSEWQSKVGKNSSVNWPVGLGGKGNEGVAGLVQQTAGALGYVELIYAIGQKTDPVRPGQELVGRVRERQISRASPRRRQARRRTCRTTSACRSPMRRARRRTRSRASPGCSIPAKIDDAAKRKAITDFLKWMLADGQKMTEALHYAQLPKPVVAKELKAISAVK